MESILQTIKKLLGVSEEYTQFDTDIIMYINTTFMILRQMGVGPATGYSIMDEYALWTDFMSDEDPNFETVKSYIAMKVRLMFDPPTGSIHMECLKSMINELEWRLRVESETPTKIEDDSFI